MCGLVVLYHLDGSLVDADLLDRMVEKIAYRGPDDGGVWVDGNIGFAHRRLAVFDTSNNGRQPMHSNNGDWTICYNGAVYDFPERRRALEARGATFSSNSDTEVLVNGFAADGIETAESFNGIFTFAAWDKKKRQLHLMRDRHGVKPLYYWTNGKLFAAASEIKALLAHPMIRAELNQEALVEYLTFQNIFRHHTMFKGIAPVPPAGHLVVNDTGVSPVRIWWDYDFSNTDESLSQKEAIEETRRLTCQAVERQVHSDVAVGSYLSGGIDTGTIATLASRSLEKLTTFTCGFDMSLASGFELNFDERRDAELLAMSLGTEHYERVIGANDIAGVLPQLVYHLEDLRMGMSYPNYYLAGLASKFTKVVLSGTGGDEIFGGYPWRYYRVFRSVDKSEYLRSYYDYWQRIVPVREQRECLQPSVLSATSGMDHFDIFSGIFNANNTLKYSAPEDHINNSLYFEAKTFLTGLLCIQERISAAYGIEERVPLLDNDLVDFAMKVPARYKLANLGSIKKMDENEYHKGQKILARYGDGKNVLKEAMRGLLPDEVIKREKQGFSPPEGSWYRTDTAQYVEKTLLSGQRAYADFIRPEYVRRIVDEHTSGKVNHRLMIWSFLNIEQWCRIFLRGDI